MNKKKLKRHPFTLIEVMVAMGVLAILMMFTLQFFNGTQKLWADAESKNEIYSDARVAMDFVSTLLQNVVTAGSDIPFNLTKAKDPNGTIRDKIYFCANSPIKLTPNATNKLYFTTFQLDGDELLVGALGDDHAGFSGLFYGTITPSTIDGLVTDAANNKNDFCSTIISRILALEFIAFDENMNAQTNTQQTLPYAITIRMTLLDSRAYEQWKGMGGKYDEATTTRSYEFRKQNERTFTRTVFLGDRSYTP